MAIVAAIEGMTVEQGFQALRDGSIPAYDLAMASADAGKVRGLSPRGAPPSGVANERCLAPWVLTPALERAARASRETRQSCPPWHPPWYQTQRN